LKRRQQYIKVSEAQTTGHNHGDHVNFYKEILPDFFLVELPKRHLFRY